MKPFEIFELEKSKYEARIADLNEELTLTEAELAELRQEREAVLRDVMGAGDVIKIEKRIETATKHKDALQERIRYANEAMKQQLASMLDDVEKQRQQAVERKEEEYREAIREHNRRKIEFLQNAKRIGELANEINVLNERSNECRREAGKEPLRHWSFQNDMSLNTSPAVTGFEDASWKALAAPEWLVREALINGNIPKWSEELMADGKRK